MFREISSPANTLTNTHTHFHRCIDSSSAGYRPIKVKACRKRPRLLLPAYRPIGRSFADRPDQVKSREHASLFSFRLTFCRFFFCFCFCFFVIVFLFFICTIYFWPPPQFVVVVTVLCPCRRLVTVDRKTSAIAEPRLAKHSLGFCYKANRTRDLRAKIHQMFWELRKCFFGFMRFLIFYKVY